MEHCWNDTDMKNLGEKRATSATLSTTDPACADLGSYPGTPRTGTGNQPPTPWHGLLRAEISIN